jgi:hypothetical protein
LDQTRRDDFITQANLTEDLRKVLGEIKRPTNKGWHEIKFVFK